MKLFGSLTEVTFSPIVTIEPRRRKFHCPIRLKLPLPAGYRQEASDDLHLLCSITGGQSRAVWEDVSGSTPLSISNGCLLFTTTVSARFWIVNCARERSKQAINAPATKYASEIYKRLCAVPFMAKFVVFAKRRDINEANLRVFCMTDDKEEGTLEVQEHYSEVAKSRDVEVVEGQKMYLEFGGNLIPTNLSGWRSATNSSVLINDQLAFAFKAFQENRLAFVVRLREIGQQPSGRIAFMEDSIRYLASLNSQQRAYLNERRRRAICALGVQLPPMCVSYDDILGSPRRNSYYASARIGDLSLAELAAELDQSTARPARAGQRQQLSPGGHLLDEHEDEDSLYGGRLQPDWMELAPKLGIPRDELEFIGQHCALNATGRAQVSPALILLMHWFKLASPETRDQDLARALVSIGRDDIAARLNFPIEPKRISRSTIELLREIELIPVRSTENFYANSEVVSEFGGRRRRLTESANSNLAPEDYPNSSAFKVRSSSRTEINLPAGELTGGGLQTQLRTREWTDDKNGMSSHVVEQSTFLDSNPKSGGGKKHRKRRGKALERHQPIGELTRRILGEPRRECSSPTTTALDEAAENLVRNLARKIQTQPSCEQTQLGPKQELGKTAESNSRGLAESSQMMGASLLCGPQLATPAHSELSGFQCRLAGANTARLLHSDLDLDNGIENDARRANETASLLGGPSQFGAHASRASDWKQGLDGESGVRSSELQQFAEWKGVLLGQRVETLGVDLDLGARLAGSGCARSHDCAKFKDTRLACEGTAGDSGGQAADEQERAARPAGAAERAFGKLADEASSHSELAEANLEICAIDSQPQRAGSQAPNSAAANSNIIPNERRSQQEEATTTTKTFLTQTATTNNDQFNCDSSRDNSIGGLKKVLKVVEESTGQRAGSRLGQQLGLLTQPVSESGAAEKQYLGRLIKLNRSISSDRQATAEDRKRRGRVSISTFRRFSLQTVAREQREKVELGAKFGEDKLEQLSSSSSSSSSSTSTLTYKTAPLQINPIGHSTSTSSTNADDTLAFKTARSNLTISSDSSSPARPLQLPSSEENLSENEEEGDELGLARDMVSFSMLDERPKRPSSLSGGGQQDGADQPGPARAAADEKAACKSDQDSSSPQPSSATTNNSCQYSQSPIPSGSSLAASTTTGAGRENEMQLEFASDDVDMDEDQLRRILTCKRLSEGCNRLISQSCSSSASAAANYIQRKNSLHMMEGLPPVTEGETMKYMSYNLSQSIQDTNSSGSGSSFSGSGGHLSRRPVANLLRDLAAKRGSQEENNTSCSSSTSLERSPTRRRSSTVSQCSSVLSEGTRNQLNFDLSPDLPPDSSLMEANAMSPTDLDRPASPEPSSPLSAGAVSGCCDYDDRLLHPIGQFSPDSTLGDSNDNELLEEQMRRLTRCYDGPEDQQSSRASSRDAAHREHPIGCLGLQLDNDESGSCESAVLERLIEDVSAHVVVSDQVDDEDAQDADCMASKRPAQVKPPSSKRLADDELSAGCQKSIFGQRASGIPRAIAGINTKRSPTPNCWSANCSTSSSSSISSANTSRAAGVRSRNSRPNSRAGTDKREETINDKFRIVHLSKLEQRDSMLRPKRDRPANNEEMVAERALKSMRRIAPVGHRHSTGKGQDLAPLCYCHR